jgi:FkbM family methyltransferase
MSNRLYPPFEHEYELRKVVRGMLGNSRGGVFVDVGANLGVWSIDFAPFFDRVYAFEPWPEYAEQLRLNLKDYGVGNVEVVEACAWDFNGQVLIGIGREDDNKVLPNQRGLGVPTVGLNGLLVKAVKLDDYVNEPFRMLKIDVEGNGLHVLRGAERLLKESHGIILLEVHNHGESHGTWQYLTDLGWRLSKTIEISQGPNWYHANKVYIK